MTKRPAAGGINLHAVRRLKKLVSCGEGEALEFKRKAAFPEKIICEMMAFANTLGGTLLIGVSDDGSIPGIKFPDEEIFVIQQALDKYCRPTLQFRHTINSIAAVKFVIEYIIPKSRRKPHFFVNADGSKDVYVRYEDKTIKASAEMKQIIKRYSPRKNVKFRYGEHEGLLMKYLHQHPYINLDTYCELTGLKRYKASQILITLVLANVLQIRPTEKGDQYLLHNSLNRLDH